MGRLSEKSQLALDRQWEGQEGAARQLDSRREKDPSAFLGSGKLGSAEVR